MFDALSSIPARGPEALIVPGLLAAGMALVHLVIIVRGRGR